MAEPKLQIEKRMDRLEKAVRAALVDQKGIEEIEAILNGERDNEEEENASP